MIGYYCLWCGENHLGIDCAIRKGLKADIGNDDDYLENIANIRHRHLQNHIRRLTALIVRYQDYLLEKKLERLKII